MLQLLLLPLVESHPVTWVILATSVAHHLPTSIVWHALLIHRVSVLPPWGLEGGEGWASVNMNFTSVLLHLDIYI